MRPRLFALIFSTILVLPLLSAHAQDKDDDDDDRPVFHPHALRPGEKPADADFSCPYAKGYQRPERLEDPLHVGLARPQVGEDVVRRQMDVVKSK